MATTPVRATSIRPSGRIRPTKALSLVVLPTISKTNDSLVEIDDAGAEDVGDAQRFHSLLAVAADLDQRQFALDMRAVDGEIAHPVHRHQPVELRLDLIDDHRRAGGDDGDARDVAAGIDLGDGEALDVVAAPGEQADHPGEDARLVVDQDRERVGFLPRRFGHGCNLSCAWLRRVQRHRRNLPCNDD